MRLMASTLAAAVLVVSCSALANAADPSDPATFVTALQNEGMSGELGQGEDGPEFEGHIDGREAIAMFLCLKNGKCHWVTLGVSGAHDKQIEAVNTGPLNCFLLVSDGALLSATQVNLLDERSLPESLIQWKACRQEVSKLVDGGS